jgi:hypothetical protein
MVFFLGSMEANGLQCNSFTSEFHAYERYQRGDQVVSCLVIDSIEHRDI